MDTESVALLAIFLPHGVAAAFFVWRLTPKGARRELRGWFNGDGDGGSPRPVPVRPRTPGGGVEPPLPSAAPSIVRLREPGRLTDGVPTPPRRPTHPAVPERVREPQR